MYIIYSWGGGYHQRGVQKCMTPARKVLAFVYENVMPPLAHFFCRHV